MLADFFLLTTVVLFLSWCFILCDKKDKGNLVTPRIVSVSNWSLLVQRPWWRQEEAEGKEEKRTDEEEEEYTAG